MWPDVGSAAYHNYAASDGPTAHGNNAACSCPTWASWNVYTQFSGGAPCDGMHFAGPFTRWPQSTGEADITDGLSNTIFFGEVRQAH